MTEGVVYYGGILSTVTVEKTTAYRIGENVYLGKCDENLSVRSPYLDGRPKLYVGAKPDPVEIRKWIELQTL